jgi:hypothetical protein
MSSHFAEPSFKLFFIVALSSLYLVRGCALFPPCIIAQDEQLMYVPNTKACSVDTSLLLAAFIDSMVQVRFNACFTITTICQPQAFTSTNQTCQKLVVHQCRGAAFSWSSGNLTLYAGLLV